MRPVFALLVAALLLSCAPAPERAPPIDQTGERFAEAIIRRPVRKPCRTGCGIVSRKALLSEGDSTYIADVIGRDSLLRRWSVRVGRPVRVWMAPRAARLPLRAREVARVRAGFRAWEKVGIPVRFQFVRDSQLAEVRVRWTDRLPGPRAGFIRWSSDEMGWLTGADIVLALRSEAGARYSADALQAVATHEVGHVLGLEHSDDAGDVMSPVVAWHQPSARDRATARVLYSHPAGRVR